MTDREAIDVLFNEWKCIDRNDGIHCDRKCETCDLVMDVGIIREAFNMAISALQAQDSPKQTTGSVQNVQNGDLISRAAAIDLWEKYHPTIAVDAMQYDAELRQLPSAQPERCEDCVNFSKTRLLIPQPEKRTEERTETHACDLIDRQTAKGIM